MKIFPNERKLKRHIETVHNEFSTETEMIDNNSDISKDNEEIEVISLENKLPINKSSFSDEEILEVFSEVSKKNEEVQIIRLGNISGHTNKPKKLAKNGQSQKDSNDEIKLISSSKLEIIPLKNKNTNKNKEKKGLSNDIEIISLDKDNESYEKISDKTKIQQNQGEKWSKICSFCNSKFKCRDTFGKHIIPCHDKNASEEEIIVFTKKKANGASTSSFEFKCKICQENFPFRSQCAMHIESDHSRKKKKSANGDEKSNHSAFFANLNHKKMNPFPPPNMSVIGNHFLFRRMEARGISKVKWHLF